jgi:hypothetical protein
MPPPPNTPDATLSGVFLQTVATMSGGKTVGKLDAALREATKAAREAVAKSKVTLELTVSPNGTGVGGEPLFKVTGKVKKSIPEKPEDGSNFYIDEDDNLSRRNPNQTEIGFTALEGGAPKITKEDIKANITASGQ